MPLGQRTIKKPGFADLRSCRFCARVFHSKQRQHGLELCSCGYPAPDKYLKWGDVYVAGALAELELGPSARNIAGARLAAERIVEGALLKGHV